MTQPDFRPGDQQSDGRVYEGPTRGGTTTTPTTTTTSTPSSASLSSSQSDAYQFILNQMLKPYGLEALAPVLKDFIIQGYTGDNLSYMLQETPEYKRRFAGNEARGKAGLPKLSPGEYIATERSYRQIMESAGLPIGFYDSPEDFASWIGNDVSPQEIKSRVDIAVDATNRMDDNYKKAMQEYYNIDESHLASYFLDQKRAEPLLQKQAKALKVAQAANRNELELTRERAERLGSSNQAENADFLMGQAAYNWQRGSNLNAIYGTDYTANDATEEAFFGTASSKRKRQELAQMEAATFNKNSGATKGALDATAPGSY